MMLATPTPSHIAIARRSSDRARGRGTDDVNSSVGGRDGELTQLGKRPAETGVEGGAL